MKMLMSLVKIAIHDVVFLTLAVAFGYVINAYVLLP